MVALVRKQREWLPSRSFKAGESGTPLCDVPADWSNRMRLLNLRN